MNRYISISILNIGIVLAGALLFTFVVLADDQPIGAAIADVPLFDVHMHYKEPAWIPYPVEKVMELMDGNGVAMGLVSSTPDEGTIKLWRHAPKRIVPELRPYHRSADSSNWTSVAGMKDYLLERLESHPHEGIGEFHIRNQAMWNEPLIRDVIAMAKARDIPLHIHSGTEPIRWVYQLDATVKIIWAHAGLGEPPGAIHSLMREFPELYADTSLREYAILGDNQELDPQWRQIIFDFQDRLMIGSDTWVNSQWDNYSAIIASNRRWLSKLPRDVAEKIAYKNAGKLFNRTVSMQQIGTR